MSTKDDEKSFMKVKRKKITHFDEKLWNAAKDGDLEYLKANVTRFNIECKNPEDNETLLFTACEFNHYEVVEFLLKSGAFVNVRRTTYSTPLYVASSNGHASIVELLLRHGASPYLSMEDDVSPLFISAQENFPKVVDALLKHGMDVEFRTRQQYTALTIACAQGNVEVVKVLLKYKPKLKTAFLMINDTNKTTSEEAIKLVKQRQRDLKWDYIRVLWIGHLKNDKECLLAAVSKDFVKNLSIYVNKHIVIPYSMCFSCKLLKHESISI